MVYKKFAGMFLITVFIASFFSSYTGAQDALSGIVMQYTDGGLGCKFVRNDNPGNIPLLSPNEVKAGDYYQLPVDGAVREEALKRWCGEGGDADKLNDLLSKEKFREGLGQNGEILMEDGNFKYVEGFSGDGEFDFGSLGELDGKFGVTELSPENMKFNLESGAKFSPADEMKFLDSLEGGSWNIKKSGDAYSIVGKKGPTDSGPPFKIDFNNDRLGAVEIDSINAEMSKDGIWKKIDSLKATADEPLRLKINGKELRLDNGMEIRNFQFGEDGALKIYEYPEDFVGPSDEYMGSVIGKDKSFQYNSLQFKSTGKESAIFKEALAKENTFLYRVTGAEKTNADGMKFLTDATKENARSIFIEPNSGKAVGLPGESNLIDFGKGGKVIKVDGLESGEFFDIVARGEPSGNALGFIRDGEKTILRYPVDSSKFSSFKGLEVDGQGIIGQNGELVAKTTADLDKLKSLGFDGVELRGLKAGGTVVGTVGGYEVTGVGIETLSGTTDMDLTGKGWAGIGIGVLVVGGVIAAIVAFSDDED